MTREAGVDNLVWNAIYSCRACTHYRRVWGVSLEFSSLKVRTNSPCAAWHVITDMLRTGDWISEMCCSFVSNFLWCENSNGTDLMHLYDWDLLVLTLLCYDIQVNYILTIVVGFFIVFMMLLLYMLYSTGAMHDYPSSQCGGWILLGVPCTLPRGRHVFQLIWPLIDRYMLRFSTTFACDRILSVFSS